MPRCLVAKGIRGSRRFNGDGEFGLFVRRGEKNRAELPRGDGVVPQSGGDGKSRWDGGHWSIYYHGWGVPKDDAEAPKRFHKAADLSDPTAMVDIGTRYYDGRGVAGDYDAVL